MKANCAPATEKLSGTVVVRILAATVAVLVLLCLYSTMAFGQCSPSLGGTVYVWQGTGTGNWDDPSWNQSGFPNSSTSSACITNGSAGTPTVVNLDINASINDLQLGSFDTLNFDPGTQLSVFGTQIMSRGLH